MIDERWKGLGGYADMLNLDGVDFREYQFNIIRSVIAKGNCVVVLPTGLGKTFIGAAVIAHALHKGQRAMLLSPTKPLAEQHHATLLKDLKLSEGDVALLVGSVKKKDREEAERTAKVIIATPQTIANDLKSGIMSLDGFGIAVFDECHHAVGKYAYTFIADSLAALDIGMLGLTASPGSRPDRVMSLLTILRTKHIEARISTDLDVIDYVMPKYMHFMDVELDERMKRISSLLRPLGEDSLRSLRNMGLLPFKTFDTIPKGKLIMVGDEINKITATGYKFGALFCYVRLLNVIHAYDLLTTEGLYPFCAYIDSLKAREKKGRAVESFLTNKGVAEAVALAQASMRSGDEHPKVKTLVNILSGQKGKSAIVFAQYRSTVKMIVEALVKNGYDAVAFVGKKEGVTQEQQKRVISDFRSGKYTVLVASSIGEEGLDIPNVDIVVFYEPIPNEMRNIQRKGRTGRFREGDVYVLFTKGTKDEVYMYISRTKERRMMTLIKSVNKKLEEKAHAERVADEGQHILGSSPSGGSGDAAASPAGAGPLP